MRHYAQVNTVMHRLHMKHLVKPTYTGFKPLEIYRHCEEL